MTTYAREAELGRRLRDAGIAGLVEVLADPAGFRVRPRVLTARQEGPVRVALLAICRDFGNVRMARPRPRS